MNHAAAKARVKGLVCGERLPHRVNLRGWRVEYPQEFPVVISTMEGKPNPTADPSGESHETLPRTS